MGRKRRGREGNDCGEREAKGETEARCRLYLGSEGVGPASEKNPVQEQSQIDIGGAGEPPIPPPPRFLFHIVGKLAKIEPRFF